MSPTDAAPPEASVVSVHRVHRATRLVLPLLALAVAGAGCAALRPAPAPIPVHRYGAGAPGAQAYVVLLPGRGGHPDDFRRAGIPAALASAGFEGEVLGVDAHLAYYFRRSVVARLRDDVVLPRPDRRPWIVGVSLGGLGALLYEKTHPGEAAGLVLLAPYLGDDAVIDEILAAGGLAAWEPGPIAPEDFQRGLWLWIKHGGLDRVPVYVGWGEGDSFARANRLLSDTVSHARVFTTAGGHTWATWGPVFSGLLAQGACDASAGPPP